MGQMDDVADKVRKALKDAPRGTSAKIARKVGVVPETIRGFKSENKRLAFDLLEKVAAELGLRITVDVRRKR